MKGNEQIIARLNKLLTSELTAIDIYFVQSRILQNKGYMKLFEQLDHEMTDEQGHATKLIERIIFLEGEPNIHDRLSFKVTASVKEMYEMDLAYELENKEILKEIIQLCYEHHDFGTKDVIEPLLIDTEEDHIDWLETQLRIIEEIGEDKYLAEKL